MKKLLPLLLLFFLACDSVIDVDPETGFELFTIESGKHSSISKIENFSGNGISVKVIFDEAAEYTSQRANNQSDINKLIGFSQCTKHHKKESARIGWRWYNDQLQLLGYVYNDSKRSFKLLGSIPINQEVNLRIDIENDGYRFSGDGLTETVIPRDSENCDNGENYWLFPYFGGDETAPHDILIQIKREAI